MKGKLRRGATARDETSSRVVRERADSLVIVAPELIAVGGALLEGGLLEGISLASYLLESLF